ncbi:MAG: glycerophosphodiester phosphodiesterase [Gemmatimonadaceae bacterium]|nr:glycerophosphodiester phosphodiesterase [Gemmatimonadaceae bacterium]
MSAHANRIPEIIAHRGASRECLENTLPAFARALELGADAIELDVHGTADGVLVVHHDPVLRLEPEGPLVPIASLLASEVAAVSLRDGARVPRLDAVCDLVGTRARLYVEVKASSVAELVVAAFDRYPQMRLAVHAFDHRLPLAVRQRRPATAIGLLSASYPLDVAAWLGGVQPEAVWQHAALIDEAFVRAVQGFGARCIAWTVNDAPHARQLAAWGVDGLCSDVPDLIRRAVTDAPYG